MTEFQGAAEAEQIVLGATGIKVSALGIGTWQWGDKLMWNYGGGGYTDEDLRASFDHALQAGINFFDTAEGYGSGRSETLLGQAVRAAQPATQLAIATKFMPYPWRLRRKSLMESLKASLKRLDMPSVDLYQIHYPTPPMPVEHWAAGLADAVQAGLTRAVGVSNFSVDQMRRTAEALARHGIPLASNQVRYHLLDRAAERSGLLKACREMNITLIAYSPLGQGLLTGKYSPEHPMPGMRAGTYRSKLAAAQPLVALMRKIGGEHGKTPSQVALNWLIRKGSLPIPGAKNLRQMVENIGALGWLLSDDEMAQLDEASA